jgi:thioredoxin-like negative regulator of GroEL
MALERLAAGQLLGRAKSSDAPLLAAIVRPAKAPSKTLLDALGALGREDTQGVKMVQIDMDEDPSVMDQLRVAYEPELILFDQGRVLERTDGAMSTEDVASFLKHALSLR